MRAERLFPLLLMGTAFVAGPTQLPAQVLEGNAVDTLQILAPPATLVSYGEASYADDGRRDPFTPLIGRRSGPEGGPRFEQLKLTGVFLGSAERSLAVLEDPTHRGYFLRLGEEVGNARLVDILSDAAVFEVQDYGGMRREVIRLDRDPRSARRRQPTAPAPQPVLIPPTPAPGAMEPAPEPVPQSPPRQPMEGTM